MNKLTSFDIFVIVAFVLITGGGAGCVYWLSSQVSTLQGAITNKQGAIISQATGGIAPTETNKKALEESVATIHAEVDPIIKNTLVPSAANLSGMTSITPTEWRKQLDDTVVALRADAKSKNITLPKDPRFYFGFSKFAASSPRTEDTAVLSKQMYGIKSILHLLFASQINILSDVRRTYEEYKGIEGGAASGQDKDQLSGFSESSRSGTYLAYPFEIEFQASPDALRAVVNGLSTGSDIFVIRSIDLKNSRKDSPKASDLTTIAHAGGAAAAPSLQYIFGAETLEVHMRVDLIEWLGAPEKKPKPTGNR